MVWSAIYPGWIYPTRFWVTKFSRSDLLRILIITSPLINVNRIARFGWVCTCGVLFIYTQGVYNLDPSLLYHLYGETLDLEDTLKQSYTPYLFFLNVVFLDFHPFSLLHPQSTFIKVLRKKNIFQITKKENLTIYSLLLLIIT